ncbi:pseudouridine synthase [Streptococcus pluranimalium]|uniref:Pseudouridine synthase n=1 Tax=Streptococcus pluranimalium TaxID=82348 RepID=A0A2L0D3J8_9STRE|nr:pseudouridine synthase [Streptococcus pluranimalium]AUW96408.1 16S rRNA pseudouridine(516) synthase [Streptococcus pluranimalium]
MRLDKFLVDSGIGSRTQVKAILKKKQITVNGKIESSPKVHITPETDQVCYDGAPLIYEQFLYYMLHKPSGVISATEDAHHKTVLDCLDDLAKQKAVFPVGRLDIDTEGLLLLTNNGQLAHAMLSPKKHVDKLYQAEVAGIMTKQDQLSFQSGITLSDHDSLPAQLDIISVNEERQTSLVNIIIQEGKFHQVKRMVKACGKEVTYLKRLSMGPLLLDNSLEKGDWRRLTEEELAALEVFGVPL